MQIKPWNRWHVGLSSLKTVGVLRWGWNVRWFHLHLQQLRELTGILECVKRESASSLFSFSVLSSRYILNLEKSASAGRLVNSLDLVRAVLIQLVQCNSGGCTDAIQMLAYIQVSAVLFSIGWNAFLGYVSLLFSFFSFFILDVSPRSTSVTIEITVSVNISSCLNRVCITVCDSFPVGVLERTSVYTCLSRHFESTFETF